MPASSRTRIIPLLVIVCITAFLLPSLAEAAAKVKLVQSGTATALQTSPLDSTYTATVPITAVDPTKAFLIFNTRSNDNTPTGSIVKGRIASGTTLEFVRVDLPTDTNTIDIQWYVVEYESGVSVQRGATAQVTTVNNVAITPVASLSQAFVTWSKSMLANSASWASGAPVVAQLTSTSNLQIRGTVNRPNDEVWWQVIEFTDPADINVQQGTDTTMGILNPSVAITIGTPVDPAKTFVLCGFLTTSGGADVGRRMLRAVLTDSTTITVDRGDVGDNISEITWQAIQLNDGSSVQGGSESFTTGQAQSTVAISSVDLARSVAFASVQPAGGQAMGSTPYIGDDIIGVGSFTTDLPSPTQLVLDRNSTVSSSDVGWFVVEFGNAADLAVVKTVDNPTPNEGDTIVYTVALTNNGPDATTGVQVTDQLPSGVTYVSHTTTQGTYTSGTGLWDVGAMTASQSDTLFITATVDGGTATQVITNTATVTASDVADTNPANDSDTADITVTAIDLAVVKTVDNPTPNEGDTIVYTVALTNNGPDGATGVQLTDLLPSGVTYVSDLTTQGTYTSGTGIWDVGSQAASQSDTLFITASVDPGTAGQLITNTATVTASDQADTNAGNDSDTADITVTAIDLAVVKTVDDPTPPEGGTIVYTVALTNNGPDGATGVQLTDLLPSGVTFSSYTATQGTYTSGTGIWDVGSQAASQSDTLFITASVNLGTGGTTITNTATVTASDQADTNAGNDSGSVDINPPVPAGVDLAVAKTVDFANPPEGGTFHYTVVLTNNGPSTATGVQLTDLLPIGVTYGSHTESQGSYNSGTGIWAITSMPPSTSDTLYITVTANLGTGGQTITNTATVTAVDQTDTDPGNDSDSVDIVVSLAVETQVTSGVDNDQRPSWDPSTGTQIAFDSNRSGNEDIWTVPSTGGAPTQLTTSPALDRHPDWSPDGAQIVYSSREGGSPDPDLWLIPAGGGSPVLLVANVGVEDRFPAFSPDGSLVAFARGNDIWVIPSTGGAQTQLTTDPGVDVHPTWSPDGNWIAFQSNRSGNNDIWIMPSTGGTAIQVTADPGNDGAPDWSPAGNQILFQSNRIANNNDVWMIAAFGGTALPVTGGSGNSAQADWSPDGTLMAFNRDGDIWTYQFPADLALTKTVDDPAPSEGGTVNYTVAITNNGPQTITGVEVTDVLPAGVTFQSASATQGSYVAGTGKWSVGTLANADSDTLTITVTVDAGTAATTVTNTASITASEQPHGNPANDVASVDITVAGADLAVAKSVDDNFPNEGQTLVYTVVLTNNGPDTATNVDVTDNLPSGVTYVSDTATSGSYAGGVWTIASVAAGVSDTLSITVTVDAGAGGSTIVNNAAVTASDQGDTITGNNSASASLTVQSIDLSVDKVVDVASPNEGATIVYTVTLANAGPDAATGVDVTDLLPTGVTYVSDVPSQGSYVSGTGVWTVGTVNSGGNATLDITATVDVGTAGTVITNTAAVTASDQADSDPGNDSDIADIAVPSGPSEIQLTSGGALDQRPCWSPDETQIVFDSDSSGNPDLWLVPSAGGATTQLTTDPLLDRHPDWSPDGAQIVYSSRNGGSADPDLWLIPAGGGTPVLLHSDVGPDDRFPAFSPDGLTVAFTKDGDIYTIPTAGGAVTQVTTNAALDIHPTWSADGTMIAFQSDRSGSNDIWKIPATGGAAVQVTSGPASDSAPDWSPSGSDIAYHSNASGNNELWMVPAGGGTPVQLTNNAGIDVQPDWSSSGSRITFARDGDIWVYNFPTDLEIVKTVDNPTPDPLDIVTFTVALSNNGPDGATGVQVTDLLPAGLTFQSATVTSGSYDSGTGLWNVGVVGGGASDTLVVTAQVDLGTGNATLTNTASVTATDQIDFDSGNDSDSASVTVNVVLAISSAADQSFAIGDPPTLVSPISITDDGTTPAITAANDLRIRVPAGLALDWDTTDLAATISGPAAAKVSGTVSYEDAGKTLVLDVTSDFAAGETVTVADLSFTNFTAASSGNLELEVGNDGFVSAVDDKTTDIYDPVPAPEVRFVPTAYSLSTARPNPFRGQASIEFDIPQAGMTQLAIYDISGRLVRMLVDRPLEAGRYAPVWDGSDTYGSRVAAGVYFVRLQSGTFGDTKKVVRLR